MKGGKNARHIEPIHAHVYGFSTCEKERFCEGVLWGKIYTGFLFIKFNQCTFYSAEHELGAWPLKLGRGKGGIFWHADFSVLLNENTAYLGETVYRENFVGIIFF